MTFYPVASPASPYTATVLPPGWNTQWVAAKAAAQAGTGLARIVVMGDSWAAGQSATPVTDVLTYGWPGRLETLLVNNLPLAGYAEGYTVAGCNPGTLTSPSSPYGNSVLPSYSTADGGIGQAFAPSGTGTTWATITAKLHPVTGAAPVSMDILTVDIVTASPGWTYAIDGGAAVNVNITGPGVGSIGQGILRRTSLTFSAGGTHTVALVNSVANGLALVGHVTYYGSGTAGLGLFRAAVAGSKSTDFATGGGTTAGFSGGNSLTPDHIIPWAGLGPASTPANANITTAAAGGYPFAGTDLAIIQLGGNDCTQGGSVEAMRKALTRFIHAFRRATPASATTPGASILFLGEAYASEYSDNPTAGPAANFEWQRYKQVIRGLAEAYGCGWLDLEEVFGETAVARGYMVSGQAHPTQNGAGTGGGDGHLAIANAIYGVL